MAFDHLRFPMTKYHPVLGARTVDKHEDLDKVFVGPDRDWHDTPEEADQHRTQREAEMVMHNSTRMRIEDMIGRADAPEEHDPVEVLDIGTVVDSATHHERVVKPMLDAPSAEEREEQQARIDDAAQARRDSMADASAARVVVEPATHNEVGG
jgi:hypothetical protein